MHKLKPKSIPPTYSTKFNFPKWDLDMLAHLEDYLSKDDVEYVYLLSKNEMEVGSEEPIYWSYTDVNNFAKKFNFGEITISIYYGFSTGIDAKIINGRVVEYHEEFEPDFGDFYYELANDK